MSTPKAEVFIYVQFEETSNGDKMADRMLRYQFTPEGNVMVQQMLDWVLKTIQQAQKHNVIKFMCDVPEYKDAGRGFVGIDAESTELVDNGDYRVRLFHPQAQQHEKRPQPQREQNGNGQQRHLEHIGNNNVGANSPDPTESILQLDFHNDKDNFDQDLLSTQSNSSVSPQIVSASSPMIVEELEETHNTLLWDYGLPATAAVPSAVDDHLLLANNFDKQLRMGRSTNNQHAGIDIGTDHGRRDGTGSNPQQQKSMLLARREIEEAEHQVLYAIDDGTSVHLGQFFDARKCEFLEDHSEFVLPGESEKDSFHNINIGTNGDNFELLGIGPQQKAHIIAEQCIPTGFAKIVTNPSMAPVAGAKEFSLMEIVGTKTMKLDPFAEKVAKHCFGSDLPQNATHLLTSISCGAMMTFVFSVNNQDLDIDEVKKIVNNRKQYGLLPRSREMAKWESGVRVKVFAHAMFGLKKEDICLSEALELVGQLPELLKKADHRALGHPLFYSCVPLEMLVRPGFLAPTNKPPDPISVEMANMMAQTRQLFDINQPLLDCLDKEVQKFPYCLSEQIYTDLAKLLEEVHKRRYRVKESWCHALQQHWKVPSTDQQQQQHVGGSTAFNRVRASAGYAPLSSTKSSRYGMSGVSSPSPSMPDRDSSDPQQQIADVLEETRRFFQQLASCDLFESVQKKCQSADAFGGVGVPFVGRGGNLATALASSSGHPKKCQYVFFHNSDCAPGQDTNECIELFHQLISKGERCIYVDTSLAELPADIPIGDRIVKFFLSKLVNTDFVQDTVRKLNTCIVIMEVVVYDKTSTMNGIDTSAEGDEQFELEIPCPKAAIYGGKCSNDECRWECDDCGQLVFIRKPANKNTRVEHFHCASCGRVPLTSAKFRCKDADLHGPDDFVQYPADKLADQLRYYGEKNLLILGETGVGKSTWINAFANFHTFGTLEEAMQSENPLCLIPTSFPRFIRDENAQLVEKIITIGPQDNNESNKTGQSQTKMPKAHVFEMITGPIRNVDTPGLADTAGLKQDQQNFKYTLRYISTLKELNGIAILMDANRIRLTPAFKYCIGQLLTHLHKDAAKNIVFVFTKCGQRKDPGEALRSLREFLKEVKKNNGVEVKTEYHQVYIMENDAFKFIHEVKQGVEFTNADFEHMEYSWSLSRSESTRLIQYILNLKPHKPMDTFSLNQARTYILALAQPLARISQAIQTDITVLTDKRDWLEALDANEMDLETAKDAMKITLSYYEVEHLNYPRTVCASQQHTEIVLDEQGQQKILYKTICHKQCGLNDVPPETSHCNQLRGCWAFNGNDTCHQCGCRYTEHMHIRYLQHLKTKVVDDDPEIAGIAEKLEKTHDKKSAVEEMIILLEKRVDDQRAEQAIISKHSAKLSTFLKRHAIMTYNDAIEEYVLMSIKDEKQIAAITRDNRKVEGLEDCLKAYREEKRIIDAAMDNNDQTGDDGFNVQAIYGELVNLHINGQNIKEMFDAEFDSQKKIYDFHEKTYARPNGRKASQNNNRFRHLNGQQLGSVPQQPQQSRPSIHGHHQEQQQQQQQYYSSRSTASSSYNDHHHHDHYNRAYAHPNATNYGQISGGGYGRQPSNSNSTYGNNHGHSQLSYHQQLLQHQQRNGLSGNSNAWRQPMSSSASAASMTQIPMSPNTSNSSSGISLMGHLPVFGRWFK